MYSHRQLFAVIAAAVTLPCCVPAGLPYPAGLPFEEAVEQSYRAGRINRGTYEAALGGPTVSAPTSAPAMATDPRGSNVEEITLQVIGKNLYVPVRINGTITIPFILDTGANDLAIPSDIASTLARAGALDRNDILGTGRYSLADGSSQVMPKVVIRQIQVGQQTIRNVSATINPAAGDPLLGQSFLARFGTVTIDYRRHVLVLTR